MTKTPPLCHSILLVLHKKTPKNGNHETAFLSNRAKNLTLKNGLFAYF